MKVNPKRVYFDLLHMLDSGAGRFVGARRTFFDADELLEAALELEGRY